jgi:hypothetical protein
VDVGGAAVAHAFGNELWLVCGGGDVDRELQSGLA